MAIQKYFIPGTFLKSAFDSALIQNKDKRKRVKMKPNFRNFSTVSYDNTNINNHKNYMEGAWNKASNNHKEKTSYNVSTLNFCTVRSRDPILKWLILWTWSSWPCPMQKAWQAWHVGQVQGILGSQVYSPLSKRHQSHHLLQRHGVQDHLCWQSQHPQLHQVHPELQVQQWIFGLVLNTVRNS